MNLTKKQIEAGLRACNHFEESYPEENTPELYEFIRTLEEHKKELERCEDYHSDKVKCTGCNDTGIVENRLQDSYDESVFYAYYNPCHVCDAGVKYAINRIKEQTNNN